MENVVIEGTLREKIGQRDAKNLRNDNQVPCVIYGGEEPVHFYSHSNSFRKLVYTPNFYKVEIKVADKSYATILKDLQFHPVSEDLLHLDFLELREDRKVVVEIPLRFVGQPAGVKEGGSMITLMRKLRVKGFPKDLIPEIEVDVSELELNKSLKVSLLDLDGLEILNPPGVPLVSVEVPRALKSAAAAEEDEEAAVEGGEAAAEGGEAEAEKKEE